MATVVQRLLRVASAERSLLDPAADERQVASYVLGNDDLPDASAGSSSSATGPPGLITIDMRDRAVTETERLLAARQVRPAATASSAVHTRPFTAVARRLAAGQAWWALWLECASLNGQLEWEALIGVHGEHQWPRSELTTDLHKRVEGRVDHCP